MAGWTNRGKFRALEEYLTALAIPGGAFGLFLATSATPPTADHNLKIDIAEIATGNGYSAGGLNVNRDATDWDVRTEDDTADRALFQIKDLVWTATGGTIPASGNGARYAGLTDRHATVGSRELLAFFDLVSDRTVSNGQTLTLQNCELRANEI